MDKVAILGLSNSGKSSLFKALTGQDVLIAPFAHSTKSNVVGIANIYDRRLERLAEINHSKKVVNACLEFTDFAIAKTNTLFDSKLVENLRQQDAFLFLLRAFKNIDVESEDDPLKAYEIIKQELILTDLAIVESQLVKAKKGKPKDIQEKNTLEALEEFKTLLEKEQLPSEEFKNEEKKRLFSSFGFLTLKDFFVVINISEEDIIKADTISETFREKAGLPATNVISICAKLEAELVGLDPTEATEILQTYNLEELASNKIGRCAQLASKKHTFFTSGPKETRAWLFRQGSTVLQCAGIIHSDLQRGFIKAVVVSYDDLDQLGSFEEAHKKGKVRLEGKEYQVRDGDVIEIRFNV